MNISAMLSGGSLTHLTLITVFLHFYILDPKLTGSLIAYIYIYTHIYTIYILYIYIYLIDENNND